MNSKHTKTLSAVFASYSINSLPFRDFESLIRKLGGEVREREGSRVSFRLRNRVWNTHRPHPGKEMKPFQIRAAEKWLRSIGIQL